MARVDWRAWTEGGFPYPAGLGFGDNNSPIDYLLEGNCDRELHQGGVCGGQRTWPLLTSR